MIRINLLPIRAAQKKERLVNQLAILSFAVIVIVVICVLTWMSMSSRIDAVKAQIKTQDTEINKLKKKLKKITGFEASKKSLQAKLDVLDKLKANRSGPVKLLDELSRATPEEVWILAFSENNGAVSMSGGGMSEESIAGFLKNLEESKSYKDVELVVIEQKKTDGHDHLGFKIRCTVETKVQNDQPKKK
jgi:type IV pilus assembly protein PilN